MKERLKQLRKRLGLTQSEFGKKINLTDAMISMIESGKKQLQPGTLKLICLTFGVNETWILTGEGSMMDDESFASEKQRRLFNLFKQLSPRAQDLILQYVEKVLSDEQELRSGDADKTKQNLELETQVG